MNLTLRIPDELATRYVSAVEAERRALEALALDEFRLGHLTRQGLKRILGLATRGELDAFLVDHGVAGRFSASDLEQDRADLQRLGLLMRPVVADTGPLHYLVLTGDVVHLPRLFGRVHAPLRVRDELAHAHAPAAVRDWITTPPFWLDIRSIDGKRDEDEQGSLDPGERDTIALGHVLEAGLLLMDDQVGVAAARRQGFAVTGTLGLLDLAARRGLVDLAAAFARLKETSFYFRQGLLDTLLAQHQPQKP